MSVKPHSSWRTLLPKSCLTWVKLDFLTLFSKFFYPLLPYMGNAKATALLKAHRLVSTLPFELFFTHTRTRTYTLTKISLPVYPLHTFVFLTVMLSCKISPWSSNATNAAAWVATANSCLYLLGWLEHFYLCGCVDGRQKAYLLER